MRTEGAEDSVAWSLGDAHGCLLEGLVVSGERGRGPAVRSTRGWGLSEEPNGSLC